MSYDLAAVPVRGVYENLAGSILLIIWRRRGLVVAAVVLSLAAAGGALAMLKKTYTAQAVVQLDLGKREVALVNEQAPTVTLEASSIIQGEAKIIRSRMMARRVVQRLGIDVDTPDKGWTMNSAMSAAVRYAGAQLGLGNDSLAGAPAPPADETEVAISTLLSRLAVVTDNRSYLIEITYVSDDPAKSARIANTFVEEYLRRRSELNIDLASNVTEWLGTQVQAASAALRRAEDEISAFRQRTMLMDVGANGQTIQQQQLQELNSSLGTARLTRLNEESRLTRMREVIAAGGVPSASDLQGSPLVQTLLDRVAIARRELSDATAKFGKRHPDVAAAQAALSSLQGSLRTELSQAVSVIRSNVSAAARIEQDLNTRLEALQGTMVVTKAQEAELRDLQAKAQTIRERLALLTRNQDQTIAAKNLQLVAGSLIMPAEAMPTPSSPKPLVVIGLGLVGGIVLGIGAVLLIERRDRGFRTTDEVEALTGIRCLAMLPELVPVRRRQRKADVVDDVIFEEALRALGAGVGLFGSPGSSRIVLVTSSLPQEGKTTICQSLARLLVGVGHRVLLIDGTRTRNATAPPKVVAETASSAPGNLMLLSSAAGDEAGVGVRQGTALMTDVFSPHSLDRVIGEARKHFDIILIDGAPAMLLADSFVLGRKADSVIHVIHWRKTMKNTVVRALHRLRDQSVVVDATVLARVDPRRHRKFHLKDEIFHYRNERHFFEALPHIESRPAELPQPSSSGYSDAA